MAKYKTREEYWRARGRGQLANEVARRTAAELRKRGIMPDPESAIYKNTFDRLSARYRDELAAERKAKQKTEAEWLEQHRPDTDEALLAYLRNAITEPKQMLGPNHITGGHYIVERFGGWQKALRLAGMLPLEEQAQSPPEEQ